MTSLISWLDANTEESNRMQELVKLFSTPETIDDLGIGQIRDVISNSLFPGTSVLHAGARYMLLVPWAYLTAGAETHQPEKLKSRAEKSERDLIVTLGKLGTSGFIGSAAGKNVLQLPSAAYWSALRRYGIVHPDIHRSRVAEAMCAARAAAGDEGNAPPIWDPSIPQPPEGFPQTEQNGLELTQAEASWLQERLFASCNGTLLAHLVMSPDALARGTSAPWEEPACNGADADTGQWVRDAELFSFVHHGTNILYQHSLAKYAAVMFPETGITPDRTAELLQEWEDARSSKEHLLQEWDVTGFIARVLTANPAIRSSTLDFAQVMAAAAKTFSTPLADNTELCHAVERRERLMKKTNSRFNNERRLRAWTPPDGGVASLTFRWPQVRRTIRDIHNGLDRGQDLSHA